MFINECTFAKPRRNLLTRETAMCSPTVPPNGYVSEAITQSGMMKLVSGVKHQGWSCTYPCDNDQTRSKHRWQLNTTLGADNPMWLWLLQPVTDIIQYMYCRSFRWTTQLPHLRICPTKGWESCWVERCNACMMILPLFQGLFSSTQRLTAVHQLYFGRTWTQYVCLNLWLLTKCMCQEYVWLFTHQTTTVHAHYTYV